MPAKKRREREPASAVNAEVQVNPELANLISASQESMIAVLMEADRTGKLARAYLDSFATLVDESVPVSPEQIDRPLPKGVKEYIDFSKEIAVGLEQAEGFRLKIMEIIQRKLLPDYLTCSMEFSYDYKEYTVWIKPNYDRLLITRVDTMLSFRITFDQYAELQAMSSDDEIFERLWAIMNEWRTFITNLEKLTSEVVAAERDAIVHKKQEVTKRESW
jgi:hypothetical protein